MTAGGRGIIIAIGRPLNRPSRVVVGRPHRHRLESAAAVGSFARPIGRPSSTGSRTMRLDTSQQMRTDMRLRMAPRMIQSMEILQLPLMALQERIDQELEENPILVDLRETPASEAEAEEAPAPAEPA